MIPATYPNTMHESGHGAIRSKLNSKSTANCPFVLVDEWNQKHMCGIVHLQHPAMPRLTLFLNRNDAQYFCYVNQISVYNPAVDTGASAMSVPSQLAISEQALHK